MAFDNRLCKFVFKWFILAFKIFCYFDKMNECYFTMIYGDYDTHRQSSFCFYKINPSSGNLKWINNSYKPNSQGYGKSKTATWLFPAPWQTSLLFDRIKPFLEKEMATHSSILAWRVPGTEEPGWAATYGVA